jgi:dTDP-4-dehydrorhamnose 3,5-epimerase
MLLTPTALPGVSVVTAPVFGDDRGSFSELFHAEKFAAMGLPTAFVQDNHSRSARHTLRGLHHQLAPHAQGKLVRAVTGRVFDVAVDLRPHSATRGRCTSPRGSRTASWCSATTPT